MSKTILLGCLLCSVLSNSQPVFLRSQGASAHSRSCTNGTEFIVTFEDSAKSEDTFSILRDRLGGGGVSDNHVRSLRHGPEGPSYVGQVNALAVCIPEGQDADAHAQVLMAMEGVQAVEENLPVNVLAVPWHLDRIDQKSLPLNGQYFPGGTGNGVSVYVLDTGSDGSHPELQGRVAPGYSLIPGQYGNYDIRGHGTHVAGIIASRTFGVAKGATVIPVKVFNQYGGEASGADIIEGINWVVSRKLTVGGPSIISMSLGMGTSSFYAGDQALLRAVQAGITPVVAAGNEGANACGSWPAQSLYAIGVGSTDINDGRSSFSNWGNCVDVYAPGGSITSTLPNGRIGVMSGTSMATPVVSGVVALFLERQPNAQFQTVKAAIQSNAVNVVGGNLVQVNGQTPWNLMASSQLAVADTQTRSEAIIPWALPVCAFAIIALALFLVKRDNTPKPSNEFVVCV